MGNCTGSSKLQEHEVGDVKPAEPSALAISKKEELKRVLSADKATRKVRSQVF